LLRLWNISSSNSPISAPPNDPRFETDSSMLYWNLSSQHCPLPRPCLVQAERHTHFINSSCDVSWRTERTDLRKSADDSQSTNCRKNAPATGGGEVFSSVLRPRPLSGTGSLACLSHYLRRLKFSSPLIQFGPVLFVFRRILT